MTVLDDDLPIIDVDDEIRPGCILGLLAAVLAGLAFWMVAVPLAIWWIGGNL